MSPPLLTHRLSRTMLPIALATACVVALGAPLTWFGLRYAELRAVADELAEHKAAEIQQLAEESPELWFYNSPKIGAYVQSLHGDYWTTHLELLDDRGRSAYRHDPDAAPYLWSTAPVAVAGRDVGTVVVGISSRGLLTTGLPLLSAFAVLGLLAAGFLVRVPLGVVDRTERLRQLATSTYSAQEEERLRLARDLHDTGGQMLTAVRLQLEQAVQLVEDDVDAAARDPRLAAALHRSTALLDQTTEQIRQTIHVLGTPLLDQGGLRAAVGALVSSFDHPGCQVEVDDGGLPDELPAAVEIGAFRAVQEGLTNALRHSGASRIGITLAVAGDTLAVQIEDNGRGCDPAIAPGFGLAGLRDRVALLGGNLQLGRGPDGGTALRATIPLHEAPGPADDPGGAPR